MLLFSILFLSSISLFPRELLIGIVPSLSEHFSTFLLPIELSVGFFTIGSGVSQLIAGGLGDTLNKKTILLWGSLFIIIGNILFFISDNSFVFLLTRFIVGIGAGIFTVLARALAAEYYQGEKLLKVMSWISMSTTFFPLITPILGSFILTYFGLTWEFVLLIIMGIFSFLCITQISLPKVEKTDRYENIFISMLNNFTCVLKEKKCIPPMLVSALFFGCGIGYLTISTDLLTHFYNIGNLSLGYFFWPIPIGYFIGTFFATKFFSFFENKNGYQRLVIFNIFFLIVVYVFKESFFLFEVFVFIFFLTSGLCVRFLNKTSLSSQDKTAAASSILGFSRTLLSLIYAFIVSIFFHGFLSVILMFTITFCLIIYFLSRINREKCRSF